MVSPRALIVVALLGTALGAAQAATPIVIGHRGASGYRPEHTLESYRLAIEQGADVIEPDVVRSKDGVLIARHENEIGTTTDVATKFPSRKVTKQIDGTSLSGWFTEDFTLAELQTLRAKERLEGRSHDFDGQFLVPTLDAVLDLAASESKARGRAIGVYPETKHPTYFRSIGLPLEEALLERLTAHGLTDASSPVFIQSFEPSSLQRLRPLTRMRLVQLLDERATVTPERLRAIRAFADGIGATKTLLIPVTKDGVTQPPTTLVADAHAAGLFVHVWTLRRDPMFLPASYKGDAAAEAREFAALGVDGIFTDFPDVVVNALRGVVK